MSDSRVIFYNRQGRPLAQILCNTERSWVLNGEGMCVITISASDPKVRREIIEFGNFVTVQHATLPLWAGVIDTDRSWGKSKIVLTAYSGERLLKFRRSQLWGVIQRHSAGDLYSEFIKSSRLGKVVAIAAPDNRLREGIIWRGGSPREEAFDGKLLYDHIAGLADRTGYEWDVNGAWDNNGDLYFQANFYLQRGLERGRSLKEGLNITTEDNAVVEQGVIINDLLALGDGSTDTTRITHIQIDAASIAQYGMRQFTMDFSGNSDITTLMDNARGVVLDAKNPIKIFSVTALDVGDIFSSLRIGNILPIFMNTVGFLPNGTVGTNTKVRILGMKYMDVTNRCDLTLQEIT
jgi:hypothetical protein